MKKLSPAIALLLCASTLAAQTTAPKPALQLTLPHSHNPFETYAPDHVPAASLVNSTRLQDLIRNGTLYLSLQDAVLLALENNLDIAIARYNLPIAEADIERTKAGGTTRGVNTGIVQNTLGGGVGGLGSGAPGAGAGGTTSGAGGAGSGASGLVQSTLGTGTAVSSFDPQISGTVSVEHLTQPLSNLEVYGVPSLQTDTVSSQWEYTQGFSYGTELIGLMQNSRVAQNSPFNILNPTLNSYYRVVLQQPLLAGFGRETNLRYLYIARNDRKVADIAFKDQIITTITQIANMYWDLASAYADEQAKDRSLQFAQETLESDRKQFALQSIPAMDVTKAEGDVAQRAEDLTIAKTTLQLQQSLIKNALTKNIDDAVLEDMPVLPIDQMAVDNAGSTESLAALTDEALHNRPIVAELQYDLTNRDLSRKAARNNLLPSVNLEAYYGGTGLAGSPANGSTSTVPQDFGGSERGAFNNTSPDYLVGVSVQIPLRNRIAKSDQYRSELEYRQAELSMEQQKKQIRIEVRNAQYALEQSVARVQAARTARELSQQSFDISKQQFKLGSGSNQQILAAEHDLSLADSALAAAEATYEKSRVQLAYTTGSTLDVFHVAMDDARSGVVQHAAP